MREGAVHRRLFIAGAVLFALPLAAHAFAGTAARYVGDDYCAAYIFRDYGLIGGQVWFYLRWGAVPTTLLLMAVTEPGGARLAPFLPAIVLALWVIAASWAVRQLSSRVAGRWGWPASLCVAEALVFATVQDAPNVVQSVYLRVPMLAYTCPLVVATVYAGFLARRSRSGTPEWLPAVASALIAFVAGAFGPVYVACQTTVLGVGVVVERLARRRAGQGSSQWLWLGGLAGSIASLLFVALAPGNGLRQQSFPHDLGLVSMVKWSVLSALFMFVRPVLPLVAPAMTALVPRALGTTPTWLPVAMSMAVSPATLVLALAVPALAMWASIDEPAATRLRAPANRVLLWLPPAVLLAVIACMAPGVFGTGAPPPPRALIIPVFVIVSGAAVWGCALAVRLRPSGRTAAVSALTALLALLAVWQPVAAARSAVMSGVELRAWAAHWDETDRLLRVQGREGRREAVVPAVPAIAGVGSIGSDPGNWVNACAARYYGVETIRGEVR